MPRGAKPGERRGGGTKPGQKLRRTIIREIMEEIADEKIRERMPKPAQAHSRKLAIEHLDEMLHIYVSLAGAIQKKHIGAAGDSMEAAADALSQDTHFRYIMEQAKDCAAKLAPYQSSTFRAIVVAPPPNPKPGELRKRFTLTIFEDSKQIESAALPAMEGGG